MTLILENPNGIIKFFESEYKRRHQNTYQTHQKSLSKRKITFY